MTSILFSIPLLIFETYLQIGIISRIQIGNGTADLFLITLSILSLQSKLQESILWIILASGIFTLISATPFPVYFLVYFFVVFTAHFLRNRILQSPLIATILVVTVGSLFFGLVNIIFLVFNQIAINFSEVIENIIVPTLIGNLLLSLVAYPFIMDLMHWVQGEEIYE